MSRRRKYTIIGIFVIGGVAAAASLVRVIVLSLFAIGTVFHDAGAISVALSALAVIEIYVALLGACAPTLGPIYDRFSRKPSTL
ncbi:hypothetical protein F4823DRAFT_565951 [Ustulina deusta]|nr:hypothetical protein F4823DRAFT_565951 [Ustulina deusta]